MSNNLVTHAKRELKIIKEEPDVIDGYLKVIQAFADMGHSGGSAMVAIPVIYKLLQYKNLAPLTDDPAEWVYHNNTVWGSSDGKGIWQNKRDSSAFSEDRGETYYLVMEKLNFWRRLLKRKKMYRSVSHYAIR